jgi:hypothetical protein
MLEQELRELQVEWPQTPDIAGAIAPRLTAPAPRRRWLLLDRPAWQLAVAAVAVVIAVVMAIPPARAAVLEFLGLRSVKIERREPQPSRFGRGVVLGDPVTLEQARRRADFPVGVPAELGEPDAVFFYDHAVMGPRVDMTYRPRPGLERSGTTGVGLLVTEMKAVATPVIEKAVGSGAKVDQFTLDGDPAVFISGRPHGFAYTAPNGQTQFEEQRLAGNTLLVDRSDGVLLRLEGELDREEAIRIARSVR